MPQPSPSAKRRNTIFDLYIDDARRYILRAKRMVGRKLLAGVAVCLLGLPSAAAHAAPPKTGGHGWSADASAYSHVGSVYRYACPPYGTVNDIWGTVTYTSDSSVCTAAVHDGQITLASGGTVLIVIEPGRNSYAGSNHDDMTSKSYGAWSSSFKFLQPPKVHSSDVGYGGSDWNAAPAFIDARVGQRLFYVCPEHGTLGTIWGTAVYSNDSSVCTAAVHEDGFVLGKGGSVIIQMVPGPSGYRASTRHGVTSNSEGKNGSAPAFVFVHALPAGSNSDMGWNDRTD